VPGSARRSEAISQKLRAQGLGGARIHQRFLEIAYVEGDDAAAAREIQWFAGKPAEYLSFDLQVANQNALGQRRESTQLYRRAAETALRHGFRNAAAEFEEADARADALSGNLSSAKWGIASDNVFPQLCWSCARTAAHDLLHYPHIERSFTCSSGRPLVLTPNPPTVIATSAQHAAM
jgi:hypothetical protein